MACAQATDKLCREAYSVKGSSLIQLINCTIKTIIWGLVLLTMHIQYIRGSHRSHRCRRIWTRICSIILWKGYQNAVIHNVKLWKNLQVFEQHILKKFHAIRNFSETIELTHNFVEFGRKFKSKVCLVLVTLMLFSFLCPRSYANQQCYMGMSHHKLVRAKPHGTVLTRHNTQPTPKTQTSRWNSPCAAFTLPHTNAWSPTVKTAKAELAPQKKKWTLGCIWLTLSPLYFVYLVASDIVIVLLH